MESLGINYHAILPETITASVAVLIMMIDALARKIERQVAGAVCLLGLIAAAVAVVSLWGGNGETSFRGMIITDDFRLFFAMIFLIVTFLTVLISLRWVEDESLPTGEYFALLMFATTGMLSMSAANDLVMIFLGLENHLDLDLCVVRLSAPRSALERVGDEILHPRLLLDGVPVVRDRVRLRRDVQPCRQPRRYHESTTHQGADRIAGTVILRANAAGGSGDDDRRVRLQSRGRSIPRLVTRRVRRRAEHRSLRFSRPARRPLRSRRSPECSY